MNRRQFLRQAGIASLTALALPRYAQAQASKPNILFLFADDLTYEAVHALGNDEVQTPNIDRLIQRGTTFTHAYNQGAWHGAVCVASRTMLATGAFVWNAKRLERELKSLRERNQLWPQLMAQAGYDTYMAGKWHVSIDPATVFDEVRHVRPGMARDSEAAYNRPLSGEPDPWSPSDPQLGGYWEGGTHWSEVLAEDAEIFLQQAATRDNPFFMYIAANAPHDPRQSPQADVDRYPADEVDVPESFLPEYPYNEAMGAGRDLRDERLAPFPRTRHAVQVHRSEYYAIITHLDTQIGRILDALEATGKADETIIVFTSDHGLAVGHHGLLGKQNMYDHSVRVPLTIAGPGIPEGKRIDTPVYLQDVMPTALELADAPKPEALQFKSLLPLMRGESEEHYEAIYGAYMDSQRMVTQDGFKLIEYPKAKKIRLYDLRQDHQEMRDLSGQPEYATKEAQLLETLKRLEIEAGL
jgi:choline-sulfatase